MMAIAKSRSFLGIALTGQSQPGGNGFEAPTGFIPVTTVTPFDNIKYLDDLGLRGSMVKEYGTIQGPIYSEFDFGGDVYTDTIGYMVGGILGSDDVSGTTGAYTHYISVLNSVGSPMGAGSAQPGSYSIYDYYGESSSLRRFDNLVFSSFDLKFTADALLTYTTKAMGYQSVSDSIQTPSFSTETPTPTWEGQVTIGGSSNIKMHDGNVNITRTVTPIFSVSGTQNPYQVFGAEVAVTGSMMFVTENDNELNYYLNNTQPATSISWTQPDSTSFGLTMSKCAFTVGKIERTKDFVETNVTFKAIANTTDAGSSGGYSPIAFSLSNAIPVNVFA